MLNGRFLFIALFSLTLVLGLNGCKQRYGYIPRSLNLQKSPPKRTAFSSHYVQVPSKFHPTELETANTNPVHLDSLIPHAQVDNPKIIPRETGRLLRSNKRTKTTSQPPRIQKDTIKIDSTKFTREPGLSKGSDFLLGTAAVLNLAMLFTPYYNYMIVVLLVGLGTVAVFYLLGRMFINMKDNKVRPKSERLRYNSRARDRMKQWVKGLFIGAGICFALALILVSASFFDLSFFFFVLGVIGFYAALLAGLVYLIMGLY